MDASMDDRIVEQGPLGNQERFKRTQVQKSRFAVGCKF